MSSKKKPTPKSKPKAQKHLRLVEPVETAADATVDDPGTTANPAPVPGESVSPVEPDSEPVPTPEPFQVAVEKCTTNATDKVADDGIVTESTGDPMPEPEFTMDAATVGAESVAVDGVDAVGVLVGETHEPVVDEPEPAAEQFPLSTTVESTQDAPVPSKPTASPVLEATPPMVPEPTVPNRDPRLPPVGSVIERVYKGQLLRVLVTETGFEFEGKVYESLSKLAKILTGARTINGYVFFQLGRKTGGRVYGKGTARLQGKIAKLERLVGKLKTALEEGFAAMHEAQGRLDELKGKLVPTGVHVE